MGKTKCCSCNKELGTLSLKFSNSEGLMRKILSHHKVSIMSPDDRMCDACRKICEDDLKAKTPEEIAKKDAKKEIGEQYDGLSKTDDEPLTVLKMRLAKGKITKEEFDKIKEDLKD